MVFSNESTDLAKSLESLAEDFFSLTTLFRKLLYTNSNLKSEVEPLKAQVLEISTKYENALTSLNTGNDFVSKFRSNVTALSEEVAAAIADQETPSEPIPEVPPVTPPVTPTEPTEEPDEETEDGGDETIPPVIPPSIPEPQE